MTERVEDAYRFEGELELSFGTTTNVMLLSVYKDGVERLRFQRTATSVGALNVSNDTADQSEQNRICTRDIHLSFSNYKQSVLVTIQSA